MKMVIIAAILSASSYAQVNPCFQSGSMPTPFPVQNDTATGTTLFKTADLTSSGNAIISVHTNTYGMVGVVVGNAGTVGSACIAYGGPVPVYVDGTSTVGHCLIRSTTTDGEGHDTGAACTGTPAAGELIGIVTVASTGANSLSSVVLQGGFTTLPSLYRQANCESGLGDGLNAITAGTYLQSACYNNTGATITLTSIRCNTDNNGTSTLNATNGAGTGLLTGAVTCTNAFAGGTQSGTVTIASGDFIKFTFVADGTSKQTTWSVAGGK
jgi:hypothetical protein